MKVTLGSYQDSASSFMVEGSHEITHAKYALVRWLLQVIVYCDLHMRRIFALKFKHHVRCL